jgi:hypothetical protein
MQGEQIMMRQLFDIRRSQKFRSNSPDQFIVTRGSIGFLRLIGEEPHYKIMTATAGEDTGEIRPHKNRKRIIETALRTSARMMPPGTTETHYPNPTSDHQGREYIEICAFEYISDAYRVAEEFFRIFDECKETDAPPADEMQKIYAELSIDLSGDDIYLSDGVWLSSDGTLRDLGR